MYFKFTVRVDLMHSRHTHKEKVTEAKDVLINLIVVVISQCIHISSHHTVRFKYV